MSRRLKDALHTLRMYPTMIGAVAIIGILVVISIIAITTIPYSEAISLWRGSDGVWDESPQNATPAWFNWFRSEKLPETMVYDSRDYESTVQQLTSTITKTTTLIEFDYTHTVHPKEVNVFFTSQYESRQPQATLTWITPDGREIPISKTSIKEHTRYSISVDQTLRRKLGNVSPTYALFFGPDDEMIGSDIPDPVNGVYTLRAEITTFEEGSTADTRLILYGHVSGVAGTDHKRRDLMVGLLWGTPIALMFGILAAVGSTMITFIIAAVGVWFGGFVDSVIQRITEVNLMLPVLPILIMIGTFYSLTIWKVLGLIILLNIFSAGIKTYRAMFLQVKNAPYIEAARAYGASGFRIIFRYMIPKVAPVLVPNFVTLTPAYVFLEASLAVLGLGDPTLPTWGKMLTDAYNNGALYKGNYYWVLEPAIMLMFTGFAFAMLGFALDRIFNPRLRGL